MFSDDNGTATRFKDGVPVSYDFKSNSEAVALLNVPLDILNSVIQLPIDILTFRLKEVTAQKDLTTEQKDLLAAVLEFKTKQDELNKRNAGAAGADAVSRAARRATRGADCVRDVAVTTINAELAELAE